MQTKKKDISEIKGNITKLTNQKEKLLGLILEEESKEIIETYREKLNSILNQISVQNELLNVYSELDIKEEENLLRGQFKEFYSDISYKDFQELDREQQKTLFNNLIEKITIDELDIPDEKETCLSITIYMKIPGYADIFVPFIKAQISDGKEQAIADAFHYIEKLLELNDEYANEVIALSVLESLLFDEDVDNAFFIEFAKPKTLELIQEIIQNLEE